MNAASQPHYLDPFAADAESGFYATPELTQRVTLIRHLIEQSEQLLLIMAEAGHGKTTLLRQIAQSSKEHWKLLTVASHPELEEERLVADLLTHFNVRSQGKTLATMHENLRSYIAATRYNGQLPVLLVDDAHMLPLSALRTLIDLVMRGEAQTRMRVLLFCEPQITSVFAATEFAVMRNALIHTLDIPPFSEHQLRGYLQFRLHQARYAGASPFSSMTIKQLHEESEGVPGRINLLAGEILRDHARIDPAHPSPPPASNETHKSWLRAGLIGLVFVVLLLAAIWGKQQWPSSDAPQMGAPQPLSLPENLGEVQTDSEPPAIDIVTPPEAEEDAELTASGNPQISIQAALSDALQALEEEPAPAVPQQTAPETEELADLPGVKSAHWLKRQNPADFTVQVLGTHERDTINRFIARYRLQGTLAVFETDFQNRTWYVLSYGLYPTRANAEAAKDKLPAALRQESKPWVRSVENIQQHIQSYQDKRR